MQIVSFRSYQKNTLQGFFTVTLSNGLEIRDCCLHTKNGKSWIQMPSKPYTDNDGKQKYSYIVHYPDRTIADKFQKHAVAALKEFRKTEQKEEPGGVPF